MENRDELKMVEEKSWEEFQSTGLLLIVNQILHIFGWAIVFEQDADDRLRVYPARVKFRGFADKSTRNAYKKLTKWTSENIKDLVKESEM